MRRFQELPTLDFGLGEVIEIPPLGIDTKRATAAIKQQVMEWLADDQYNVTPKGTTNPVKALRRAFQYQPQLVFLLSDAITGQGQYEIDQRLLLDEIEQPNRSGTKINTIQFIQEDPLVKAGLAPTMKLIADQSGGVYKYVPESELNK